MSYNNSNYPPPQGDPQYQQYQEYPQQGDLENQPNGYSEKPQPSQDFDDSFKVDKPKFNDWPFAIFFWLVVFGFIAIAGITLNALKKTYGQQGSSIYNSTNSFTLNTNTVILFGFVIVVAVVLSIAIIVYARLAPRIFITSALILNIILGLARELDVDILVWGGTHKVEAYTLDEKFFINPGSVTGSYSFDWPDNEDDDEEEEDEEEEDEEDEREEKENGEEKNADVKEEQNGETQDSKTEETESDKPVEDENDEELNNEITDLSSSIPSFCLLDTNGNKCTAYIYTYIEGEVKVDKVTYQKE
ncbi:hypothetical protein QCA50_018205 [Cerrena zonata]|uniref:Uncharacterized protein n=1 Tax=Cerrena zonata TaxID=2478898 RepID=A0AAW0FIA0_9APHY